jgi:hypothetical protein
VAGVFCADPGAACGCSAVTPTPGVCFRPCAG